MVQFNAFKKVSEAWNHVQMLKTSNLVEGITMYSKLISIKNKEHDMQKLLLFKKSCSHPILPNVFYVLLHIKV
jgi:hypothetical protein